MCLTIQDLAGDINTLCKESIFHAGLKIKLTLDIWKEVNNYDLLCEDAQLVVVMFLQDEHETAMEV